MKKNIFLIALTAIAAITSFGEPRKSRYSGNALEHELVYAAGATIEIQPSQPRYIQGQRIYLNYRISCPSLRCEPWNEYDIPRLILLFRDGQAVPGCFIQYPRYQSSCRDSANYFEGQASGVFGCFYSPNAIRDFGWNFLYPGHYVGYFDDGILSPDFSFNIDPFPDSLQVVWNALCHANRQFENGRWDDRRPLDSALTMLRFFCNRPVGSLWRIDGIASGLSTISIYQGWGKALSTMEREFADSALIFLADEPDIVPSFYFLCLNAIMSRIENEQAKCDTMTAFTQRLLKPALLDEVRRQADKWARLHPQKNKR
jgi:hypothetical protein